MRKAFLLVAAVVAGVLGAGLVSAVAATGIVEEETLVVGEHTVNGKVLDLAGVPDDFRPGDRYIFRSELTDADGGAGHLWVDCSVHFAKNDVCTQVYRITGRGTVVVTGLVPASELHVDGTWTLAITGGTGDFENVRGSVTVVVLDEEGNSEHTLNLLP
jgi:hypothetical protein